MFSTSCRAVASALLTATCALPVSAAATAATTPANTAAPTAALTAAPTAASTATTTTLYDAAAGTLPSAQGWTVLSAGAAATQGVAGGLYSLDTTGAGVGRFGNGRFSPVVLDTTTGFDISFSLRVLSETHTSPNRAGFSFLMLGSNPAQGLELAFWAGNVWAQDYVPSDPDRFVHGADAAFDTTAALQTYTLAVRNQGFTFSAGSPLLLSGSLRNYTADGAPYTTPNFLFFGDNSTRGVASVQLGQITITPVPEPTPALLLAAGLAALAWRAQRRRQRG